VGSRTARLAVLTRNPQQVTAGENLKQGGGIGPEKKRKVPEWARAWELQTV
jgi:hypothetical protein